MFNFLKSIFTSEERPLQIETWGGGKTEQESDAKAKDTPFGVSLDGIATIRQMKNGKFRLLVNQNEVIGTYGRKRDAVRGATRQGLVVAEA